MKMEADASLSYWNLLVLDWVRLDSFKRIAEACWLGSWLVRGGKKFN
jgi:hypothetical protein